jgi:hypothetical protein
MQTKRVPGDPLLVANPRAERKAGGWSICETRRDWRTILFRLKKDGGVPNKAVDAHFKETKKIAKRKHS